MLWKTNLHKLCGVAKNAEECKGLTEKYRGLPVCTWFELKNPFFNAHCIATQGGNNIGIGCVEDSGCFFGGEYCQLAFSPGGYSIMGGGRKFNGPSKKHLESILECCYPRQKTALCKNFRDKFKNLPTSTISPYFPVFRTAYNKIVSCP